MNIKLSFICLAILFLQSQSSVAEGSNTCQIFWCGPNENCCGSPTGPVPFGPFEIEALNSQDELTTLPNILTWGNVDKDTNKIMLPFAPIVALANTSEMAVYSGVIADPKQILTAAHCLCDDIGVAHVFYGDNPSMIHEKSPNVNAMTFGVSKKNTYLPKYCDLTKIERTQYPDIGIIEVAFDNPDQKFNAKVQINNFMTTSVTTPYEGYPGFSVGFGASEEHKDGGLKEFFEYPEISTCNSENLKYGCNEKNDFAAE